MCHIGKRTCGEVLMMGAHTKRVYFYPEKRETQLVSYGFRIAARWRVCIVFFCSFFILHYIAYVLYSIVTEHGFNIFILKNRVQ